jgi:hypothetical protein
MSIEELRTAHRAAPFQPFLIRMADDRLFPIQQPEFLSISPSGRTVIVYNQDDSFSLLDFELMRELEMLPNAS